MDDLGATRALLHDVFPHEPKYGSAPFLEWQYRSSPSGTVIEANEDDDRGRTGHYAVLPQRWHSDGAALRFALSLNTAVADRARGQGMFTRLAEQVYAAARDRGTSAILGVANAQSTPGFLGRLQFDLVGPLPVSVLLPSAVRSHRAVERTSEDDLVATLGGSASTAAGTWRTWDEAELRWRLADPIRRFTILQAPEAAAITCLTTQRHVRIAVIVKVFVEPQAGVVDLAPLATAACRVHRAVAAIHAGFNPGIRLRGFPLPHRLRPSPLNLIVRSLVDERPSSSFVPTCFEFLDFDAY